MELPTGAFFSHSPKLTAMENGKKKKKKKMDQCCWGFHGGPGLRLYAANAGGVSWGTKIQHSKQHSQKIF